MESIFAALETEWLALKKQDAATVKLWEQQLADVQAEEAQLRANGRWFHGRSDFLGVIGCERDELTHSRVIAWLLDPCARHGFGTRFLAGVLEEVFGLKDVPRLDRATTKWEVPLVDGRLDIVVEGPDLHLVIENKVDAREGEDQCSYYARYLPPETLCIFLTPGGRASRTSERFRPMRYAQIAGILRRLLKSSDKAAPGASVAEDYLRTLTLELL